MFENGAVFKTPDEKSPKGKTVEGKTIILLHLHGDVFCLLEVVGGILSIVRAEKWEYSRQELPLRLEGFEEIERGRVDIETPVIVKKIEPKPEPKPEPEPKVEPKAASKERRFFRE